MHLSTYFNLGLGELAHTKLTVELADRIAKHPKGIAENVLVGIGKFVFAVDFIILDMPEDVKVPLILRRPFLSNAHAKMLSLRERMELDLEARLMGETLILNRSLDPLYGDYIELNDLNVPLELRRNQVDELMPTIEEGEVVDKPMIKEVKIRNDDKMVSKNFRYPSSYDEEEKIRIDYAYNLKFSCMIGFEFVHANFFPNFPINVMSKKFYNSIMKDKIEFRRMNELGNFTNVPVFIRNFYVITDFTVVEDMDPYLDEGMGDVVVGEPFCKVSCVETKRFDGIITIHDEDDSVTYQMVQSHPMFKHLTNEKMQQDPAITEGTDLSQKDKNKAKTDKTKHGNKKSVENQSRRRIYLWWAKPYSLRKKKHFKTVSLDESRSLDFHLFFDKEEYSEEEDAETMAKTMKQYMSKTRADYESGVARPKIEDKDNFELKGQFLKELRTNTFSGSDHEDANEHIEKVLEIYPIYFILDSRGVIPSKTAADAKEKDLGSFTVPCFINNVYFDNALVDLGASVSVVPLSTYLNLGLGELARTKLTVELADRTVKYPKGIAKNVLVGIGKFVFPIDFIILDMPEDIKGPLMIRRPFLSTARAKIDVFK
ncbi:putative reverse transcriptase domain-containing protein [Tanacetum coccineum]